MSQYFEEEKFVSLQWEKQPLVAGDYEGCRFEEIMFGNASLREFRFTDCVFVRCNFSAIQQAGTVWSGVQFEDCKMLGLHFEEANRSIFSMSFKQCQLDMSSFFQCSLKKTVFDACSLRETDFTAADLRESVFHQCDLADAKFEQTDLQGADFRTALHYRIQPDLNKIKKAKFSWPAASGLLESYGIQLD